MTKQLHCVKVKATRTNCWEKYSETFNQRNILGKERKVFGTQSLWWQTLRHQKANLQLPSSLKPG